MNRLHFRSIKAFCGGPETFDAFFRFYGLIRINFGQTRCIFTLEVVNSIVYIFIACCANLWGSGGQTPIILFLYQYWDNTQVEAVYERAWLSNLVFLFCWACYGQGTNIFTKELYWKKKRIYLYYRYLYSETCAYILTLCSWGSFFYHFLYFGHFKFS